MNLRRRMTSPMRRTTSPRNKMSLIKRIEKITQATTMTILRLMSKKKALVQPKIQQKAVNQVRMPRVSMKVTYLKLMKKTTLNGTVLT